MHKYSVTTKKGGPKPTFTVADVSKHHLNPFGLLVTRKLHWIVLRDVDVGVFAMCTIGACFYSGRAFEIIPKPNPYNGNKLVYFVQMSGNAQHTVATIHHKSFPVSFREDAEQQCLDILEEECIPVSASERLEFRHWMSSFNCPHFDRWKKSLMRHLERSVSGFLSKCAKNQRLQSRCLRSAFVLC